MGKAIEITYLEHSASDLRELAAKAKDADVARRLLAIALLLDGWPRHAAATACGMDRQTLCDWVHRYNAAGVAGLATAERSGRPAKLSTAQMAELKQLVIDVPIRKRTGLCAGAVLICTRRSPSTSQSVCTGEACPSCCEGSN